MSFKRPLFVKGILFIALALVLFLAQFVLDITAYFNPEQIKTWLNEAGRFAPVVYMVICVQLRGGN